MHPQGSSTIYGSMKHSGKPTLLTKKDPPSKISKANSLERPKDQENRFKYPNHVQGMPKKPSHRVEPLAEIKSPTNALNSSILSNGMNSSIMSPKNFESLHQASMQEGSKRNTS